MRNFVLITSSLFLLFLNLSLAQPQNIENHTDIENTKAVDIPQDEIDNLKAKCENGDVEACSTVGAFLYEDNPKEAFKYYSIGCEKKDPVCCFNVADFYQNGVYVPKDENKAIYFYKLSCEYSLKEHAGYCGSCYILGEIYLGKTKFKESAKYYNFDCENKCCEACFKVEQLYKARLISKDYYTSLKKPFKRIYETCHFLEKVQSGKGNIDFEE